MKPPVYFRCDVKRCPTHTILPADAVLFLICLLQIAAVLLEIPSDVGSRTTTLQELGICNRHVVVARGMKNVPHSSVNLHTGVSGRELDQAEQRSLILHEYHRLVTSLDGGRIPIELHEARVRHLVLPQVGEQLKHDAVAADCAIHLDKSVQQSLSLRRIVSMIQPLAHELGSGNAVKAGCRELLENQRFKNIWIVVAQSGARIEPTEFMVRFGEVAHQ